MAKLALYAEVQSPWRKDSSLRSIVVHVDKSFDGVGVAVALCTVCLNAHREAVGEDGSIKAALSEMTEIEGTVHVHIYIPVCACTSYVFF